MTFLVPANSPHEHHLDGLRAQVSELATLLDERRDETTRFQTELAAFRLRYRQEVGLLHDELDRLELAIAEAELGELAKRVAPSAAPEHPPSVTPTAPQPRFTTDAVRKLFRDVAKAVHPDLAQDETARDQRHSLMIEANRAYASGDEDQLRWILHAWERSPEAVQGSGVEATRLRLVRRIAQIEEQLESLSSEVAALKESPLGQLKALVENEAAKGKDLIMDMVRRLKRDIVVATNRLEAMQ